MKQCLKEKKNLVEPKDLYRETLIRYLGYSHEIGDAFGKLFLIPKKITNLTYGLTASYVLTDIGYRIAKENTREHSDTKSLLAEAKKQSLWQLFATLILPRIAIHGITEATSILVRTNTNVQCRMARALSALVALGSIPYIVKPIDNLVDKMLTQPEHKVKVQKKKPIDKKSKMKEGGEKDIDIYRDTYLRYLGYTNEVGEAFRHLWPRQLVRFSYGVAIAYVLADASDKGLRASGVPGTPKSDVILKTGDVLIWQMLASVIIPGFTINRITKGTGFCTRRFRIPNAKYIPTVVGLASIPLIIHPIDRLVDYIMDNTYRKYLK